MNNLSQLQGEYCHLEYLKREEGDEKRHKTRCSHHCTNNYCTVWSGKCRGSAHCEFYKEKGDEEINKNKCRKERKEINCNLDGTQLYAKEKLCKKGTVIYNKNLKEYGKIVKVKNDIITIRYNSSGTWNINVNKLVKSKDFEEGKISIKS